MSRRHQNGTLELRTTKEGAVWYLRFVGGDGKRLPRIRLGLKTDLPSKVKVERVAQPYRDKFNAGELAPKIVYTVADVVSRYENEEIPKRYSTARGYRQIHKLYIGPRWGNTPIDTLVPLEVRAWLRALELNTGQPASSKTKGHVHTQFKNLLKHAMLWRWMPPQVNPLALF